MHAFLLMAGSGPLLILTSHESIEDEKLLDKLLAKGVSKRSPSASQVVNDIRTCREMLN